MFHFIEVSNLADRDAASSNNVIGETACSNGCNRR